MSKTLTKVSIRKQILSGSIGGIIGGIFMMIPIFFLSMMMGMPADGFVTMMGVALGSSIENAAITGGVLHFLASGIIGILFTIVTGKSKKLSIFGVKKGVALSVVTAAISMAVLGMPIMFGLMPPVMMQMMLEQNPETTQEFLMEQMQGMFPFFLILIQWLI